MPLPPASADKNSVSLEAAKRAAEAAKKDAQDSKESNR